MLNKGIVAVREWRGAVDKAVVWVGESIFVRIFKLRRAVFFINCFTLCIFFYGTTIPAAIIFFNMNKPEERKDKVLMVYAAREGWYKEEANLNILLPHDILRIVVQLEAWGNIETAKQVIPIHQTRLNKLIDDNLEFKLGEIDLKYEDEEKELAGVKKKLDDKELSKPDRDVYRRSHLERLHSSGQS